MAVRLTAPHPKHGNPGQVVKLDDPQDERDLITAGYGVDASTAPKAAAKKAAAKPKKTTAAAKPTGPDGD